MIVEAAQRDGMLGVPRLVRSAAGRQSSYRLREAA
jgi:hypothetical protein